jgi:hypothetical protein
MSVLPCSKFHAAVAIVTVDEDCVMNNILFTVLVVTIDVNSYL